LAELVGAPELKCCVCVGEVADGREGAVSLHRPDLAMIQMVSWVLPPASAAAAGEMGSRAMEIELGADRWIESCDQEEEK
jgi:hypothetical protein